MQPAMGSWRWPCVLAGRCRALAELPPRQLAWRRTAALFPGLRPRPPPSAGFAPSRWQWQAHMGLHAPSSSCWGDGRTHWEGCAEMGKWRAGLVTQTYSAWEGGADVTGRVRARVSSVDSGVEGRSPPKKKSGLHHAHAPEMHLQGIMLLIICCGSVMHSHSLPHVSSCIV